MEEPISKPSVSPLSLVSSKDLSPEPLLRGLGISSRNGSQSTIKKDGESQSCTEVSLVENKASQKDPISALSGVAQKKGLQVKNWRRMARAARNPAKSEVAKVEVGLVKRKGDGGVGEIGKDKKVQVSLSDCTIILGSAPH